MAMVVWDNKIQQHLMLMVMGQSSDFFFIGLSRGGMARS